MDNPLSRRTVVFVVRVWAEYLEQTPPAWRGEIEHVGMGEAMRFGDVGTMLEFLEGFAVKSKERDDLKL
jgi:hypothetical protein